MGKKRVAKFPKAFSLRLHSALGYRPPEEFEQAITSAPRPGAATLQFFRPDEGLDHEKAKRMQRAATRVC